MAGSAFTDGFLLTLSSHEESHTTQPEGALGGINKAAWGANPFSMSTLARATF